MDSCARQDEFADSGRRRRTVLACGDCCRWDRSVETIKRSREAAPPEASASPPVPVLLPQPREPPPLAPGATPRRRKKSASLPLPPTIILVSCASDHESIVSDLTNDTTTPRERCTPEHSMHTTVPCVTDAQLGRGSDWPQSAQYWLPGKL